MLAIGKIVPQISRDFDRYWNSPSAYPADQIVGDADSGEPIAAALDRFRHTPQMSSYQERVKRSGLVDDLATGKLDLEWTTASLVSDDPAKGQGALERRDLLTGHLKAAVGEIAHRFDGVSPYFVPGNEGVEAFTQLEQRSVEVRMLTNSLAATDVLPVHAGYASRREDLLEQGIELFELRPHAVPNAPTDTLGPFGSSGASLHAKTFAVDGERIFIGSFNFDPRSARLNTEMGLLIHSEHMAKGLHQVFDNGLGESSCARAIWSGSIQTPRRRPPGRKSRATAFGKAR
ncbi:MAG: phospholipase D-like domain-containing protein [Salinisphaera sp.]|nr:phospholipase D-like domain-containing protein [Salinisphaera sp.]